MFLRDGLSNGVEFTGSFPLLLCKLSVEKALFLLELLAFLFLALGCASAFLLVFISLLYGSLLLTDQIFPVLLNPTDLVLNLALGVSTT